MTQAKAAPAAAFSTAMTAAVADPFSKAKPWPSAGVRSILAPWVGAMVPGRVTGLRSKAEGGGY